MLSSFRDIPNRQLPLFFLALTFLAALACFGESAQAAPGANQVKVFGSVDGKTLTVHLRARPKAKCNVSLGSGKDRARLPRTGIGTAGRGLIEWSIPSSTPTGVQPLAAACGYSGDRATGSGSVDIPESAVSGTFTTVLNVLLYVFLLTSLVIFFAILIGMVVFAPPRERFPRSLALIGGAVVALAAEVTGVGFADYIVDALAGSSPAGQGVKLLAIVIPGGAAVAFGWYFSYALERSTLKAMRWMILLGMLTLVTFATILAEATKTQGVFLGDAAIPNASFIVGLILSILAFGGAEDEEDRGPGRFRSVLDRVTGGGAAARSNPFAED